MKKILYFIVMLCCTTFVACDKQTTPEALDVQVPPTKSEDYFEALVTGQLRVLQCQHDWIMYLIA